jgi:hypothetical protein
MKIKPIRLQEGEKMRIFFISLIAVLVFAVPAMAAEVDVELTIDQILVFNTNNVAPLTCTLDAFAEFDVATDIGDVDYDLTTNQAWQVDGIILDGAQNGQVAADWDSINWTLSVNAVTLNEATDSTVDSGGAAVNRTGSVWEVLLTVPWPESQATPDCTISLTASLV